MTEKTVTLCPHLGDVDPTRTQPDKFNRCFALAEPVSIALPHQANYCLRDFAECPVYPKPEAPS